MKKKLNEKFLKQETENTTGNEIRNLFMIKKKNINQSNTKLLGILEKFSNIKKIIINP